MPVSAKVQAFTNFWVYIISKEWMVICWSARIICNIIHEWPFL